MREQLGVMAGILGWQLPRVEAILRDTAEDILAFTTFPRPHRRKIWSTNPLERVNEERSIAAPTS